MLSPLDDSPAPAYFRLKTRPLWRKPQGMSDKADNQDRIKQDGGKLKAADKQARLAEALRANLRRRKQQDRNRKEDGK